MVDSGPEPRVKLIIQIPCLNEESALPVTLSELPREVDGFDEVEWLIIDDGSTDRTVEVARAHGVDHVVRFTQNKGLAVAFQAGLDAALKLGADVIVNTDADNQYRADDIPKLVAPILEHRADMVIGDRQVADHPEFSTSKKLLQRWGSWVVRQASETDVPDTTSGFRAYSREAALRMNVVSRFTYTLETIIQAGKSDIAVTSVPIRVNGKLRQSRLFKSIPDYVKRSVGTIFRIYTMHEPLRVFSTLAAGIGLVGLLLFVRFAYFYFSEDAPTGPRAVAVRGRRADPRRRAAVPARHHRRPAARQPRDRRADAAPRAQHRAAARRPARLARLEPAGAPRGRDA